MRSRHRTALLCALAVAGLVHVRPLPAVPVSATLGIDPDALSGADPDGRVLLYTPDPLELGSSIAHWDISAFPNLLMEPNVSTDISVGQLDLTVYQMRDVGWPTGGSTITLRILDLPGEGYYDSNLGAQRRAAMEYAAGVWASRLGSSVEINVEVGFRSLACAGGSAVLAQASAEFLFESFPGAPVSGTWYHGALAESLSGRNLSLEDVADPDAGDLVVTFNDRIDEGCLSGVRFHYGLSGNVPSGRISFVNVALHELAHGLGFASFIDGSTGELLMGLPDVYSRFIFDNTQGRSWIQMNNSQRRSSAVNSERVVWSGSRVTARAANVLDPGSALTVGSPASIAGIYSVGIAAFGPPLTADGITGELVLAVDGSASPTLLCQSVANAAEVDGKIAVLDRGTCLFVEKVRNAQDAGAIGVVVVNNEAGPPLDMGGNDPSIVIPSVSISDVDGDVIKAALEQISEPGGVSFSAASFSVAEGAGAATVRVRRTGGTGGAVAVDYATTGGTATAGEDYLPAAGTVTFADGQGGTRSFQVEILDDADTEGEETVELVLSNPTGGAVLDAPSSALVAIADDDVHAAGFLAFGSSDFQGNEGGGSVAVTVERSGGTVGAVAVDYATGGGTATAGEDYQPAIGTIAFADGEGGGKSFEVEILDDAEEESVETVGLALSDPTGGALLGTPSSAVLEIVDNEACQAGTTRLCLNQGRFRVEVGWRDFDDRSGSGQVVLATEDSGLFWFFAAENWEMLVKVLDGCAVNDRVWVFAAATTNVEYTLQVTDTVSGEFREYSNPLGVSSPAIIDTAAFAGSCP
ncbi:MAG: hypothetical protein GY856_00110 [bacterium]|nr:hypothetical protein [bacterium]